MCNRSAFDGKRKGIPIQFLEWSLSIGVKRDLVGDAEEVVKSEPSLSGNPLPKNNAASQNFFLILTYYNYHTRITDLTFLDLRLIYDHNQENYKHIHRLFRGEILENRMFCSRKTLEAGFVFKKYFMQSEVFVALQTLGEQ